MPKRRKRAPWRRKQSEVDWTDRALDLGLPDQRSGTEEGGPQSGGAAARGRASAASGDPIDAALEAGGAVGEEHDDGGDLDLRAGADALTDVAEGLHAGLRDGRGTPAGADPDEVNPDSDAPAADGYSPISVGELESRVEGGGAGPTSVGEPAEAGSEPRYLTEVGGDETLAGDPEAEGPAPSSSESAEPGDVEDDDGEFALTPEEGYDYALEDEAEPEDAAGGIFGRGPADQVRRLPVAIVAVIGVAVAVTAFVIGLGWMGREDGDAAVIADETGAADDPARAFSEALVDDAATGSSAASVETGNEAPEAAAALRGDGSPAAPSAGEPSPAARVPVPERPSAASRRTAPVAAAGSPPPAAPPPPEPSAAEGRLLVRSMPPGAEVIVNGESRGNTPLALAELPYGPYEVEVVLAGYPSRRERFVLAAGDPIGSFERRPGRRSGRPTGGGSGDGGFTSRGASWDRIHSRRDTASGRRGLARSAARRRDPRVDPRRAGGRPPDRVQAGRIPDLDYHRGGRSRNPGPRGRIARRLSMNAVLALENGSWYPGAAAGARGVARGEVVFNTSMTGYQEVLTDPSYARQIVTMTCPEIGNYGVSAEDVESRGPQVAGFVVREASPIASNWRSTGTLRDYLGDNGVVAIAGIDTRALTRELRTAGAMRGIIATGDVDPDDLVSQAREVAPMEGSDLVQSVTCAEPFDWPSSASPEAPDGLEPEGFRRAPALPAGRRFRIAAYDFGLKRNILRRLAAHGCDVRVFPAATPASELLAVEPDGVFLSNGPGDPAPLDYAVANARQVIQADLPVFGICLGHQVLALAMGATTYKLKFGHRGANHPVKHMATEKVEITSPESRFRRRARSPFRTTSKSPTSTCTMAPIEGLRHRTRNRYSACSTIPKPLPGRTTLTISSPCFLDEMERRSPA